jgi:hypothetical protein
MDFLQETDIIKLVKVRADLNGSCDIGTVAEEILHYKISEREKQNIADRITGSKDFHLEKKGNHFIIHKRNAARFSVSEAKKSDNTTLKLVVGSGVTVHIILATLHLLGHKACETEQPPMSSIKFIIDSSRIKPIIKLRDSLFPDVIIKNDSSVTFIKALLDFEAKMKKDSLSKKDSTGF